MDPTGGWNGEGDWLDFGPSRREKPRDTPPGFDRTMDLEKLLGANEAAARGWGGSQYRQLPPGEYLLVCTKAEWRPGKGSGKPFVLLVWHNANDKNAGTVVDPLYLQADSPPAVEFALRRLRSISQATGIEVFPIFRPGLLHGAVAGGRLVHDPKRNQVRISEYIKPT